MDFEPCFKVYNLVSIRPKSMKLGQMINLNVIFHMMGSVYRLVTIRNSPQFPVEFRNGLFLRENRDRRCERVRFARFIREDRAYDASRLPKTSENDCFAV